MSDDPLDDLWRRLEERRIEHDRQVTDDLEEVLAVTPRAHTVPMPGEVHPAYVNMPWLVDWLNRRGPYAQRGEVLLPAPVPMREWTMITDEAPTAPAAKTVMLTRRRCAGPRSRSCSLATSTLLGVSRLPLVLLDRRLATQANST